MNRAENILEFRRVNMHGSKDKPGYEKYHPGDVLTRKVQQHLKKNKIRIELDGPDATFIAPKGKVFGNQSRRRHIEDFEDVSERELLSLLSYE